jgi:hypothetical protein
MDLSKPIHPQQFVMTVKLNATGSYFEPVSLFSSPKWTLRLVFGSLYGGSQAGDWAYLPDGGSTYFTRNGTGSSTLFTGTWYNVTSWKTGVYSGSDVNVIGTDSPGYYQTPQRSTNGYFFEIGFMKQMTLSSESTGYYDNRPPL